MLRVFTFKLVVGLYCSGLACWLGALLYLFWFVCFGYGFVGYVSASLGVVCG